MPKKKITEEVPEVPQETIERLDEAATEAEAPLYADAAETAVEETERAVLGETESFTLAEKALEMDADAEESPPFLSAEGTPDIVAVRLEDGTALDTADAADTPTIPTVPGVFENAPDEDVVPVQSAPNGIEVPAAISEEAEESAPMENESDGEPAENSVSASVPAESNRPEHDAVEQTLEDERRAFYGLDFNELDRDLTPEQRQEWNSIYASYRGHNAMSGTIVGIDRHRIRVRDRKTGEMTWHRVYCAIVIPFRVRILIPETEMWMKGQERPGFVLRNMPGAKIDFVIIHVDREAGFAVGSRRQALPSRRYYFATRPELNTVGSRTNCEVLVVGPRRCLVSCHGYDLDLTQRELSYTAVPDLRDVYHSGQPLNCIVKAYDREKKQLTISVKETVPNPYDGAVFRHPVQSHRQGVIAGKYGGGVFCNLSDGVTVMCNYSFHYDDSAFRAGDRVMLIIQRYDNQKKQVYGKIVAKC